MLSKSILEYLSRKGKWHLVQSPVPKHATYRLHSHSRPVEKKHPLAYSEDSPDNKVITEER